MNEYRIRETGQVVAEKDFRATYENVSFKLIFDADIFEEYGIDPILQTPPPATVSSKIAKRDGVEQNNLGNWVQKWVEEDLPSATVIANLVEAKTKAIQRTYKDVDDIYKDAIGNRATEYAEAEAAALAYKNAGYTGEVSDFISVYAQNNATLQVQTNQWAADAIITQANTLRTVQSTLRATRFEKQKAIRLAETKEALDIVVGEWNTFIETIRSQLGI